jgi:biotin operon repressor
VPANGFRRVYTELHRLKEWGVEVASGELGYCLRALPVSA